MARPPRKQPLERWWRGGAASRAGVQLAGRGKQCGFLDLVDRPLLVAVLDPARPAAGAGGDRVQTKADGDQGRSAQRAAWHQRTSVRSSWLVGTYEGGGRSVGVRIAGLETERIERGRRRAGDAPRLDSTGRGVLTTACHRDGRSAG